MRRLVVGLALLAALAPLAVRGADAAAAFATAWAAVTDYTTTITTHEIDGKGGVQDRVYHYAYLKPHFAKIDIVSGPGRGGGAVWSGGDTVKGHQGGLFSGIKQTVSIHDGRATSLRGDPMDQASFQFIADALKSEKSEPAPDATVGGAPVDGVTVDLPPGISAGATKMVIYFSRTTHLPVRRTLYVGDTLVKQEDYSDVKSNTGLSAADFT